MCKLFPWIDVRRIRSTIEANIYTFVCPSVSSFVRASVRVSVHPCVRGPVRASKYIAEAQNGANFSELLRRMVKYMEALIMMMHESTLLSQHY